MDYEKAIVLLESNYPPSNRKLLRESYDLAIDVLKEKENNIDKINKYIEIIDQKEMIIKKFQDLVFYQKIQLYKSKINPHCCPWKYGYLNEEDIPKDKINCGVTKCSDCREIFWNELEKQTRKEVE